MRRKNSLGVAAAAGEEEGEARGTPTGGGGFRGHAWRGHRGRLAVAGFIGILLLPLCVA